MRMIREKMGIHWLPFWRNHDPIMQVAIIAGSDYEDTWDFLLSAQLISFFFRKGREPHPWKNRKRRKRRIKQKLKGKQSQKIDFMKKDSEIWIPEKYQKYQKVYNPRFSNHGLHKWIWYSTRKRAILCGRNHFRKCNPDNDGKFQIERYLKTFFSNLCPLFFHVISFSHSFFLSRLIVFSSYVL